MDKKKISKVIDAVKKALNKESDEAFVKKDIKWKGMSSGEKNEIKNALALALSRNKVENRMLVKKMLAFLGSKIEDLEEEEEKK